MTREKVKEIFLKSSDSANTYLDNTKVISIDSVNIIINEMYDSFTNRKCEDCKHFSAGKQPDGLNWHKCEYSFECKTCFNDYFEKVEK